MLEQLPTTSAGLRSLNSQITRLVDDIDPHLDAFSRASVGDHTAIDQAALLSVVQPHRELIESAIMLLSVRLSQVPLRSLYVGGLLVDLCDSARGGRCSRYLQTLYDIAARIDPPAWSRLRSSLDILTNMDASGCQHWPLPQLAREACVTLDEVEQSWAQAVVELRARLRGGANRGRRRDPAYRRAITWHQTIRGLLERLKTRGGPARLIIDYCFMIIARFEYDARRLARHQTVTRATADLLILEVFGILAQFSFGKDSLENTTPHYLEQGDNSRRKRIQRSRLKVLTTWQVLIDDTTWVDWALPKLGRVAGELEHAAQSEFDSLRAPHAGGRAAGGRLTGRLIH